MKAVWRKINLNFIYRVLRARAKKCRRQKKDRLKVFSHLHVSETQHPSKENLHESSNSSRQGDKSKNSREKVQLWGGSKSSWSTEEGGDVTRSSQQNTSNVWLWSRSVLMRAERPPQVKKKKRERTMVGSSWRINDDEQKQMSNNWKKHPVKQKCCLWKSSTFVSVSPWRLVISRYRSNLKMCVIIWNQLRPFSPRRTRCSRWVWPRGSRPGLAAGLWLNWHIYSIFQLISRQLPANEHRWVL